MNIATKLMASLVASVVLTACSGGGSSGSSPKPNSESTPKVDMSAPKAEQPKKEEAPQADSPKAEKPKSIAPLMMENPKVEKQKENNLQEKSPKADEPQVMDPKLDYPQKDDQKLEEPKNKSNAEILKELGVKDITSGIISISDIVLNLKLDEKNNVEISLLNEDSNRDNLTITNKISSSKIKTLNDSTGKLLGYYGYIQLSQVIQGEREGIDNINLKDHYLLSMSDSEKRRPDNSLEYKGNMFYQYTESSNEKLEAIVSAKYNHIDKKLSMEIFGKGDDYWRLGNFGSTKLPIGKVDGAFVGNDGTILNSKLYSKIEGDPSKLAPDANFSGGIFGKNGEVLVGSAIGQKWQGVIGATATETNKK